MTKVSVEEAQAKLAELLQGLAPGDELLITKDNKPVGWLVACAELKARRLGAMQGTVTYMAPDFDAPLDEFREYME